MILMISYVFLDYILFIIKKKLCVSSLRSLRLCGEIKVEFLKYEEKL